ncbi:MAG: GntR family transcriptional regulator [Actinomycetota bacterium]|nr:GntR family transcriptional regulator [Actinomycetota bacterium]
MAYFPRVRLREQYLAARYGTSRTPVRNVLRRLEGEGVLLIQQNRGEQILNWDNNEISDIYDLRADIESQMARIAATKANAWQIDTLKSISSQQSKAVATSSRYLENVAQLNYRFHSAVAQIAKSKTLSTCHDSLMHNRSSRQRFKRWTTIKS